MKRILIITSLLLIVSSGCSIAQSQVTFREKTICVGQSTDSVEDILGPPDWAYSRRIPPGILVAEIIDVWINPGTFTIEWGYRDEPESLILWLEDNAVQFIWLVDSEKIK